MPHFGLMDFTALSPEDVAFHRARLHVRSGRRLAGQGDIAAGLVTLFDALYHALKWYYLTALDHGLNAESVDNLDDAALYTLLVRAGVIRSQFDYSTFCIIVDAVLDSEPPSLDFSEFFKGYDEVMTQLGIMPFDESLLPPENLERGGEVGEERREKGEVRQCKESEE